MDCVFCSIAGGELGSLAFADERVVVIPDLHPVAGTHLLVITREHLGSVREVTEPTLVSHMVSVASRMAEERGLGGYRLVFNVGEEGGQTVAHLHLHVIGGRRMTWPPG